MVKTSSYIDKETRKREYGHYISTRRYFPQKLTFEQYLGYIGRPLFLMMKNSKPKRYRIKKNHRELLKKTMRIEYHEEY